MLVLHHNQKLIEIRPKDIMDNKIISLQFKLINNNSNNKIQMEEVM